MPEMDGPGAMRINDDFDSIKKYTWRCLKVRNLRMVEIEEGHKGRVNIRERPHWGNVGSKGITNIGV